MTLSAVIVSWDDAEATARAVQSLAAQTTALDEIVVVDNHPGHPAAASPAIAASARVVRSPVNTGFAGGAALGIRETSGDWVVVMNPDAVAAPECLERLLEAVRPDVGVVGAQILLPGGRTNGGDNPVHLSGITWAGRLGEPREVSRPRSVASVSGAGMLIRRTAYHEIGGFAERYFLYHEDVDLSWRMRIAGWDVVFQPTALIEHDYAFDKGFGKWFFLERNRAWTVLSCYSLKALCVLGPLLIASEIAVWAQATRNGWVSEKRQAVRAVWRARRSICQRHRAVQRTRRRSDAEILKRMTARFDTGALEAPIVRSTTPLLSAYRAVAIRLLR